MSAEQGVPAPPARTHAFQVHLRGVVDLLSRSLYSGPHVFLRELLQNGHDAIAARQELPGAPAGMITVTPVSPASDRLVVVDNGIGLTVTEVSELLATVGRSSKRDDLDLPRTDRLGQFGIGLLSCFMISDDIRVLSRSARGDAAVEWIGRSDGTFTVREFTGAALPVGTRVELTPRPSDLGFVSTTSILDLATRYGRYLPVPVRVDLPAGGEELVTAEPVFAEPFDRPSPELLALGRELMDAEPFDAIELHVPSTGTRGTAFVLPFPPSPGARQATRVYLGGMLLAERVDDLLPEWAFFVRCVVNTTGLHPTASRESLIQDDALEETRTELGSALRRWIVDLATRRPAQLAAFLAIHDLALRALVLHDDELGRFLVPWLPVETSAGRSTYRELVRQNPHLRYAQTLDEFRQIAGIARPEAPVINGGYVYDADILRRLPDLIPGTSVERVTVADELDALDVPPLTERAAAQALAARADAALADLGCTVAVRSFAPATLPVLYVADPGVLRRLQRESAKEASTGFWSQVLGRIDAAEAGGDGATGRLCLNWRNRLVRALADTDDDLLLARTIRVLYVQSLLAAHRPLRSVDRTALTDALTDIVHLSAGLGPTGPTGPIDAAAITDPAPDAGAGADGREGVDP